MGCAGADGRNGELQESRPPHPIDRRLRGGRRSSWSRNASRRARRSRVTPRILRPRLAPTAATAPSSEDHRSRRARRAARGAGRSGISAFAARSGETVGGAERVGRGGGDGVGSRRCARAGLGSLAILGGASCRRRSASTRRLARSRPGAGSVRISSRGDAAARGTLSTPCLRSRSRGRPRSRSRAVEIESAVLRRTETPAPTDSKRLRRYPASDRVSPVATTLGVVPASVIAVGRSQRSSLRRISMTPIR